MVHISNVFCEGHLQIINCVGIVQIHWVFHCTETFWSPCIFTLPMSYTIILLDIFPCLSLFMYSASTFLYHSLTSLPLSFLISNMRQKCAFYCTPMLLEQIKVQLHTTTFEIQVEHITINHEFQSFYTTLEGTIVTW
jgi:hypothetical protein